MRGVVEPEELPFNCAFRLCHRLDSLKYSLKLSLGRRLCMKDQQLGSQEDEAGLGRGKK